MRRSTFIILLVGIFTHSLYPQSFDFSHLDNTHGLSNNQVECIFKDSRGFIWFGTNSGLNRYDGRNFKVYKHSKKDSQSIPYNRVTSIQEDLSGNLWLTSTGGNYFAIYDYKTEKFIANIDSVLSVMDLPPSLSGIQIDNNKNLYLYYSNRGFYKYNPNSGEKLFYEQSEAPGNLNTGEIQSFKVKDGFVWILFRNGLLQRLNENTGKVDIQNTYFLENSRNATIDKTVFIDSQNDVWIYPSVDDQGTACLNVENQSWIFFGKNGNHPLSNNFVRDVDQDNEGLIWIATDHGGVNVYDKSNGTMNVLGNDIFNANTISHNSVISLYCDQDGIVWAGTYKNGVSYYHPNMFKFKKTPLFYHFKQDNEIFDCNVILKDKENRLWIGTNGNGLIQYDEKTDKIRTFKHTANDNTSISSNIITGLSQDHSGKLWIGTFMGGMNAFNGESFTHYQMDETNSNSLSSRSIYGLLEDDEHNIWIATLGGGVNKLDASRTVFTRYNRYTTPSLPSNYIVSMSVGPFNNIYLSTDNGICYIDAKDKQIKTYFKDSRLIDSISNNVINNTFVDSRNLVWIATDNGLNVYNPLTRSFTYITTNEGLPSDEVVSIIEDNNGNMWAGTRNGLSCIFCSFPDNKLDYSLVYFDTKDGLPSQVCNQNAIYKDRQGIIYVGCTRGYISFNPDDINFNEVKPQPKFTELLVANQIVSPNRKFRDRVILKETISDIDKLVLKHNETNFTLRFSALNYIHPEKNSYRYMLHGLDTEWTEVKNGIGSASYSNLNPGNYKLIVYASNDDGVWSDKPITMEIIVRPPFWMTWWAFLIYLVIIAFIIQSFVKYKLNRQKKEFEQTQKIMEANKTHEVDELKFRFFTNISHEFKTPITLILTPLEKLLKEPVTDEQRSLLNIMRRNALNLLNMVNEILEFRKLDLKKMSIHISSGDIISFVKDICQSFSSLASDKSIKLTFTSYLEELQMDFDPEKMNKIVTNLLSNAFKFTEKGHIDISVGITESLQNRDDKMLAIKVSDTGIGIEEQYMDKIFDRFFRIDNPQKSSASGTGVGLHLVSEYVKLHNGKIQVESIVGKGSVFTVLIPIGNSSVKEIKNQNVIFSSDNSQESVNPQEIQEDIADNRSNLPLLLAVDDNEDFRQFIRSLFIGKYRVVTANNGEEAWNEVLKELPDLILCDVMMPVMDGYEFCRKVKEDIRTSHIPVILLTAKSSEENKYSGIEAGADDYISKPFNIDMLSLKIEKIIEKQKKSQSNFKKKIDISPSEIQIMTMDEKFVKKAVSIVEQNMDNPEFLVEDLCREMAMSRVYFYKKILALTDKSPSEFIRFIRLKRAADLLEKSQMFVNEVAFQVGFNDPKYFRKYFKEEFGVTPTEYKKKFSDEQ